MFSCLLVIIPTLPSNLIDLFLFFNSDGKRIVSYWLPRSPSVSQDIKPSQNFKFPDARVAQIKWDSETNSLTPDSQLPGWVFTEKLVVKPDQLIKRRGKAGLLGINKTWSEGGKQWIEERAGKQQQVSFTFYLLLALFNLFLGSICFWYFKQLHC